MRYNSLMNPAFLADEIDSLQNLIVADEELEASILENSDRITKIIEATNYNSDELPVSLTHEQVTQILIFLGRVEMNSFRYSSARKFHLKVYRALQQDKRWITATKFLKFLKK